MIKEQIQECIQKILDNELGGISTNNCPRGGIEKYRYMTAYRLSKYVNFYRTHRISLDDFLISLRNYLLVFQTSQCRYYQARIHGRLYRTRKR